MHTTKTATESSVLANKGSVNLCHHLPNHSRNAGINSPKFALFAAQSVNSFQNIVFTILITNERADGLVVNVMPRPV